MEPTHQYWTFDLSPFIFHVKNLNFQWLSTWWGIPLLIVVFGGSFLISKKTKSERLSENIQALIFYALFILAILFGLHKYQINWGLRWYSTMYLVGLIAAYVPCLYWIKKKTLMLTENMLTNLLFFAIISGLIGARLAYVFIYNWDLYKHHPAEIIATWEGGLSFHGGIVGVITAIVIYCKIHKISFLHVADKLARVVPIGIAMGRIGNFMNGELWGRAIESKVPWAIVFPDGGNVARHPSQIYQSLGEGWGLALTLFILSRFRHREGNIFSYFIIFYCLYRFIVEYFRAADSQINYFYLNKLTWAPLNAYPAHWMQVVTMGQILCFIFFIAGLVALKVTNKNILVGSPEWVARNEAFFKRYIEKK